MGINETSFRMKDYRGEEKRLKIGQIALTGPLVWGSTILHGKLRYFFGMCAFCTEKHPERIRYNFEMYLGSKIVHLMVEMCPT